ncbi:MAG: hypothetical protein IPM57_09000 [Oligoflexia bacterium]|nr:hypothetical protein [Oligoflexia bacterium]
MKSLLSVFSLIIIYSHTLNADSDLDFNKSWKCLAQLTPISGGVGSVGRPFLAGEIVHPAKVAGKKGMYLYKKDKIVFCKFPKDSFSDKEFKVFRFKHYTQSTVNYINFKELLRDPSFFAIGSSQSLGEGETENDFPLISCSEEYNSSSIAFFNKNILYPAIKKAKKTFDNNKRPQAWEQSDNFIEALNTCKKVEGLRKVSEDELKKFESPRPVLHQTTTRKQ